MEYQHRDSGFSVVYRGLDERFRSKEEVEEQRQLDREENRLKELLAGIATRHELNTIFSHVAEKWGVWKGSVTKNVKGDVRFICQLCDFENVTVVVCRFRFVAEDHDAYDDTWHNIENGRIARLECEPPTKGNSLDPATTRWIHAPGNLSPHPKPPLIYEGPYISPSLNRHDVLQRLQDDSTEPLNTEDGPVSIRKMPDGIHLFVDDLQVVTRRYPTSAVELDASWRLVRSVANSPDKDPCLILSERENEILAQFSSQSLPLLINGSAGSGKTTVLSLVLGSLVSEVLNDLAKPKPLFLTYSEKLCQKAQERLQAYLIILCGVDGSVAESLSQQVCQTFSGFVDSIIGDSDATTEHVHRAAEHAADEWSMFSKWWTSTHTSRFRAHDALRPEDCFRLMKLFIFGYVPVDREPTNDERLYAETRRASTHNRLHNYTARDLETAFKEWASYRFKLDGPTLADRSRLALAQVRQNPAQYRNFAHIIVDEIQDFSTHDIRLINELSTLTDGLPVILAGDEMQSIAPSGFTFAGCQEDLESLAKEHNFKVNVRVSKMQENFRNLPLIAELTTSVQRLALKEHKNRELNVPTVHRSSEGPGIVGKIMKDEFGSLNHTVLASLTSMASAKVLPCKYEEKEHFIDSKEFARGIGVDPDSLPHLAPQAFSTVEECKGLEFPTIILCGFAKALAEAIESQNLQWILSALNVAVSRARNHVIFLDADDSWPIFYQRLSTDGRFPVERLSTTERIEISLDEEIDILIAKFDAVALLKDEAERSAKEVDQIIRLLKKETDVIAEEAKLNRLQDLRLGRVRRLLASWCHYIESKSIETRDWEEFARYDSGFFGRMVDRAIDEGATSSLKTLFKVQSEYVGNLTAELFIASCIIATDSNFNGTHPERVQLFAEYLEQFSARNQIGWITDLSRNNAKVASFYGDVVNLLKTPTTDWEPDSLDRAVNDLSIIDPASPLAAYVDVCGSLSDAESAQKKLSKWRAILTAADDTHFERVVLIRLFGLDWVDDEALLTQLGDLLTSGSDLDKSLRSLMNTEAARECARRNLETILSNIRSTDGSEGPSQLYVSIAAVSSVVNDDLDDLIKELQNVKSSFQYS